MVGLEYTSQPHADVPEFTEPAYAHAHGCAGCNADAETHAYSGPGGNAYPNTLADQHGCAEQPALRTCAVSGY